MGLATMATGMEISVLGEGAGRIEERPVQGQTGLYMETILNKGWAVAQ